MSDQNIIQIGSMKQAQTYVEGTIEHLKTAQSQAVNTVTELLAGWKGEAASGFGRALDKWIEDFGTCIEELNRIEQQLGGNQKVYFENETNQNQHVQQLLAQIEA